MIIFTETSNVVPEIRAELGKLMEEARRFEDVEVLWLGGLRHVIHKHCLGLVANLKIIVSPTTGLDHIDLEECERRGITVLSLQGEPEFLRGIPATAEHTWALLLALVRRIPWAFDSVKEFRWDRNGFVGTELKGKVLGILGMGRVGTQVAAYGRAFQMEVIFNDEAPRDFGGSRNSVALFKESDILSIHLPLTARTRGVVGPALLSSMKSGSFLINTSRGHIVDEDALLEALESGHFLAGAALDVLPGELQGIEASRLVQYAREHDNLLITPHLGGATYESMEKTQWFMLNKLKTFLASRKDGSGQEGDLNGLATSDRPTVFQPSGTI